MMTDSNALRREIELAVRRRRDRAGVVRRRPGTGSWSESCRMDRLTPRGFKTCTHPRSRPPTHPLDVRAGPARARTRRRAQRGEAGGRSWEDDGWSGSEPSEARCARSVLLEPRFSSRTQLRSCDLRARLRGRSSGLVPIPLRSLRSLQAGPALGDKGNGMYDPGGSYREAGSLALRGAARCSVWRHNSGTGRTRIASSGFCFYGGFWCPTPRRVPAYPWLGKASPSDTLPAFACRWGHRHGGSAVVMRTVIIAVFLALPCQLR